MRSSGHRRAARGTRQPLRSLLAWSLAVAASAQAPRAQTSNPAGEAAAVQAAAVQAAAVHAAAVHAQTTQPSAAADSAAPTSPSTPGHPVESTPAKRQIREAEDAYLAGAKKLTHDELDAAEAQFQRAQKLDPTNRNYALAISVTRQHRVTELVQRAAQARMHGNEESAASLLAEARAIDPDNPVVLEHSGPFIAAPPAVPQAIAALAGRPPAPQTGAPAAPLADRTRMLTGAANDANQPYRIQAPILAGAIRIRPEDTRKDFHLNSSSPNVLRGVAAAYGINAIIDDTVEPKNLRFNLTGVDYQVAMNTAMSMAHAFAVPIDETTILVAKDDAADRQRLERQLQETIYLPGLSTDQINELAQVVKSVFDIKQTAVQPGLGDLVIRAPQSVLDPLNRTVQDLLDSTGEVMIEVKLYEVDKMNTVNAGATLPTQFSVFNVDQAATSIVNANQTLVQQALSQGLIPAGTSNLDIALALIKLGLVNSSFASNLLGVFGGGLFQTGISGSAGVTVNLGLNSSDSRALDDVQLRVGDRQAATFREGNKYPITSSTYTTGISNATSSALSNATINGVSVASLLQQYSGATSATIPQVTYEDLGITLKATPVIQKSGRIALSLDLKIEALAGSSLDGNPVLESRQFTTGLTVANGESALLVSNVSRTESAAMTGLPLLSEIPGFPLPLEDTLQTDTNQLVVVVTPHIVRRRSDLVAGPRIPTGPAAD